DASQGLFAIVRPPGYAKPQHVHGRTEFIDVEACPLPDDRMAPIGANDQIGENVYRAMVRLGSNTNDAVFLFQQVDDLRLHPQMEGRVAAGVPGKKVEKVPLRHECNKLAARGEIGEVGDGYELGSYLSTELPHFLVGPLEKVVEDAELI